MIVLVKANSCVYAVKQVSLRWQVGGLRKCELPVLSILDDAV
jgi:hypothetical protein